MQNLKLSCPGKVNLRLDVVAKRTDGYHDLRSIMERISVSDEIELSLCEKGIEITSDNEDLPLGEDNIVFQAVKEILAYSSRNIGIKIHIKKNIPISSGLGGGSSNAASVIKAVNQMLKLKLSKEKLMQIGLKVGADVPFFLFEGPAIAEGVGEELTKIKSMPKLHFIIVNPKVPVSTEEVFKAYKIDEEKVKKTLKKVKIPNQFKTKREIVKFMNNDLEEVTLKRYPIIDEIKDVLDEYGAMGSQMSGSGPTVFGIFADKNKLDSAYEKLADKYGDKWKIFKAENLAA